MTLDAAQHRSGKGSGDENFPVASWLIAPPYRRPILAFYEFVRIADDIADHATLAPSREARAARPRSKRACSASDDHNAAGVALRAALAERSLSPRHAQDLLTAFRMDVTKLRYADWDDLIDYCRYSAMPVGRFVLDVHGESRVDLAGATTSARRCRSSITCRIAGRTTASSTGSISRSTRSQARAPASRRCVRRARRRCSPACTACRAHRRLLDEGSVLRRRSRTAARAGGRRHRHAGAAFRALLRSRDPLSERVHLGKPGVAAFGALGAAKDCSDASAARPAPSARSPADERRHTR